MTRNRNVNYVSRRRRTQTPVQTRSYARNNNIALFQYSEKLGMAARVALICGFFVTLGLVYLMNANGVSKYGPEIQKVDKEISELEIKKSDLEIENARLTSLSAIENSDVAKEMKQPTSVQYAN